jgi:AcrR family transcriptional regulator
VSRERSGSRKDALRNHRLLVVAAREVFVERGIDAPLDEVARRAGVGSATLYRHFPTRDALVNAIVLERVDEFLAFVRTAVEEPDAWSGLTRFLEGILEQQAGDRILREMFLRYPPGAGTLAEVQEQMRCLVEQLLTRAHDQGALRPDFGVGDLALLLWSFTPVIEATVDSAPTVWRRHLHWTLDGLRPHAATPQDEPALTDEQLTASQNRLREQRFRARGATIRNDETSTPNDT